MAALVAGEKARMYALGGVARGGAVRGGYHSPKVFVAINGVHYATARAVDAQQVDNETLTITWARPNRCSFEMRGVVVADGAEVVVTMGTKNTLTREFAGNVLSRTVGYVGSPANTHHEVNAIDFSWALNSRKVTKRYINQSGTAIGQDLIASFAVGYTATHVEADLPVLDEITFTNEDLSAALEQLANRLGATQYIDFFRDLHLFTSEPMLTDPRPLVDGDTPLLESISATFDPSQIITRVFVDGGGVNALTEIVPGETILPVSDVAWYETDGGVVTSGPQRLTYTGLQEGGSGSLVGPGVTPDLALTATLAGGAGLGAGLYDYGFNWVTASGETTVSPLATVTTGDMTDPSAGPTAVAYLAGWSDQGGHAVGDTLTFALSFSVDAFNTVGVGDLVVGGSIVVPNWTGGGTHPAVIRVSGSTTAPALARYAHLWVKKNAGAYREERFINTGGAASLTFGPYDIALYWSGAFTAGVSRAVNRVALSAIAVGPTGTTARKVWRTAVGGGQLKLLATIANNTATTLATDTAADGSLGANAPTSDTSGLTTVAGQVNAGSTSLLSSNATPFSATGGWARISGDQVIRYTGISGNTLTGIPASGPGAILTAARYGAALVAAPALTGIPASGTGAIVYTIKQGDAVNLVAQVDDLAAQALLAALLTTATYTHDGIIEDTVVDNRLSLTEATARGEARLALRNQIDVSARLVSRDMNMRLGRLQTVTLADLGIDQSFKVQAVTVRGFTPSRSPYYDATLSSDLFSFEDLLRLARKDS